MTKKFFTNESLKAFINEIKTYVNNSISGLSSIENVNSAISTHNSSIDAHSDIRNELDTIKENNYQHFNSTIFSEDGSHGLRFYNCEFELFQDDSWQKLPTPEIMTLAIDLTNSNPDTCCTYEDKAASMTAKSEEWDDFFGYYPVLMKNGQEVVRLNPNDYSKDLNGNSVDITSGDAGDVMIAFPRRGLKISTSGDILRVSFTNNINNSDFKYYAHQYNGVELNKFYIGAYEGFVDDNGALRSLSGKAPTVNVSLLDARSAARANGDGYEQLAFYQFLYLQCIYLMKYKSLDCQTALGKGRVAYDGKYEIEADKVPAITGTLNTTGLDFGNQTGLDGMKLAGVEHVWGSSYKWLDGCKTNSSRNYQLTTKAFDSSTDSDYTTIETTFTSNSSGYLRTPIGTSEGGFLSNGSGGSATTYFCDMQFCNASRIANCGGNWDTNQMGGIFLISFYDQSNEQKPHVCGRLMKL